MGLFRYLLCCGLLLKFCVASETHQQNVPKLKVEYEWEYLNFTWPDEKSYNDAVQNGKYIARNAALAGVKLYKDRVYLAIPRVRNGVAVTLGSIPKNNTSRLNILIDPFPSWELNQQDDCSTLQSVQSMEIDKNGIMWVLDGVRINSNSNNCPAKILLIDLNDNNKIVQTYTFPAEITLTQGGFLNDIVVDDTDGEFGYITDHSAIDPGLVIYSRKQNRAWKIRDGTMFAELDAANFIVNNYTFKGLATIDGIALSPGGFKRNVYYCELTGFNIYSISTDILKQEYLSKGGDWRVQVKLEGRKPAQTDGMVVDNLGNLYYGLLTLNGLGKWNVNQPFSTSEVVDQNNELVLWPDSFGFDDEGNLYLLANMVYKYFAASYPLDSNEGEVQFRIFSLFTGTKSYLYYE